MREATASSVSGLVPIGTVARELGLSPSHIRGLTKAGVFSARLTSGGHRRYHLAETRAAWLRHKIEQAGLPAEYRPVDGALGPAVARPPTVEWQGALAGLEEHEVWLLVGPMLDLERHPDALAAVRYVFTEMLNNAIDHSGGSVARVRAWRSESAVVIEIEDDGQGAYEHLSAGLGLPDRFAAIQELTKGKRTTAPDRHTGEGIFFSSKAVDIFRLACNGLVWVVDNLRRDTAVGVSGVTTGTRVTVEVDPATTVDLGLLFRRFTEDHRFVRTRPVVKLFEIGVEFVSRSEAKRLLLGMEDFTAVEIDFAGVKAVGQGFVDELLRVWPQSHPEVQLIPTNMNDAVEFMVRRGLPPAEQDRPQ